MCGIGDQTSHWRLGVEAWHRNEQATYNLLPLQDRESFRVRTTFSNYTFLGKHALILPELLLVRDPSWPLRPSRLCVYHKLRWTYPSKLGDWHSERTQRIA
jgi:hypothetical protein